MKRTSAFRRQLRQPVGFTLLELLVALALFAVIAALSYGGLASMVRNHGHLAAQSERLAALQLTVGLIERDLRQAVVRPIRDRMGENRPTLVGQSRSIELSALNAVSPLVVARPTVVRVGYSLRERHLQRQSYAVLDRAPDTRAIDKNLLDEVDDFTLRYLNREQQWLDFWPAPRPGSPDLEALPLAVELRLRLADYGTIRRVIALPDPIVPPNGPTGVAPGLVHGMQP